MDTMDIRARSAQPAGSEAPLHPETAFPISLHWLISQRALGCELALSCGKDPASVFFT
ncbi:hypothetical protein [Corynebacterium atypicum]|uniref:hypothetical protein n=1 Tax=Corynebacterium atypicum TaxID=191610 RepID=UPI0012B53686|nr:hypothetical protein [Corynebacterium atypicum]